MKRRKELSLPTMQDLRLLMWDMKRKRVYGQLDLVLGRVRLPQDMVAMKSWTN